MQEETPRWPSRSATSVGQSDLHMVLAHTDDFLAVVDEQGRTRFANRLPPGAGEEDVIGAPMTKWIEPAYHADFRRALEEALEGGAPRVFEIVGKHGQTYEARLRAAAAREGRSAEIVMTAHDISERRRLEKELVRTKRMLTTFGELRRMLLEVDDEARLFEALCERTLLESAYSGIWIGSLERTDLASIRHVASGGDLAEVLRKGDVEALAEDDDGPSPVAEAVSSHGPVVLDEERALHFVSRMWSGGARTRTRRAAIVPIRDGPHTLAVAIVASARPQAFSEEDVQFVEEGASEVAQALRWMRARTERRLLVDQLVQSQKMEAIGRIAAGVAHDFNNQLTTILGFADMLTIELDEGSLRDQACNIVRAAERSAHLVAQLLAFARKGPFAQKSVDMRSLLVDLVAILERSVDKRIAVKLEWNAELRHVEGDPQQLENALLNLALNARDAMPAGGTIRFVASDGESPDADRDARSASGGFLSIDVIDEGVGMDVETQQRMFEPFFTTKPPGEGTGLGLAAVYGTVQRHRGFIEAESAPGRGSRFRVTLPARRSSLEREPTPSTEEIPEPRGPSAKARLLVIDDEPLVGALVVSGLGSRGYEVEAAIAPEGGIAKFEEGPGRYDLVLLDLVMPRIGGAQVFHTLRRARADIPVLLMSGYSMDRESEALLEQGAIGFLQKPFTVRDLLRRIGEALGRQANAHG